MPPPPTITAEIRQWWLDKKGLLRGKIYNDTRKLYIDGENVCIIPRYISEFVFNKPDDHILIKSCLRTCFICYYREELK